MDVNTKFSYTKIIVLFGWLVLFCQCQFHNDKNKEKWFPEYDFNIKDFQNPDQSYGPMARWWWPGNNVDKNELKREISLFADHGFAGLEIQPFNINLHAGSEEERAKILSWDTPDYYNNVASVLEEAKKRGLFIDMNNGSGWPVGGPFIKVEDGIKTLDYQDKDIIGGRDISVEIPKVSNSSNVPSSLVAVVAAKVNSKIEGLDRRTTALDPESIVVLTDQVKNDSIQWAVPEGEWKLVAYWSKPQSEKGSMVAGPEQGPVTDHFNAAKVEESYNYLFGDRTGLQNYYGNPLRAVFNDSYEFAVERFFTPEFINYFKDRRGYDITPWFAVNMVKKYNYVEYKNPHKAPSFYFDSEDWRLRYDYDLTISELFGKNFINTSSQWLEKRGMLHRNQVYGLRMDMIANAGFASIPETESMLGVDANLKIMGSGAHLYNRPVLSAESVVFAKRGYMTTPQKIKIAVDKLFAAGVNQIIYHGIPYKLVSENTTEQGWYPFYMGKNVAFSSHLGEGTQFWENQKQVNQYITRTQYALRSGKPHADVLIYYPFNTVEGMPENPEEVMAFGYLPDVEPALTDKEAYKTEKQEWAQKIYPVINQLEANGITWEWINDESIQNADIENGRKINIRGNYYQALMLVGIDVIQLNTAKQIKKLTEDGMNFAIVGEKPTKQPSYLNWEENDKATFHFIDLACKEPNSMQFKYGENIDQWIRGLHKDISFNSKYDSIRQVQREMSDGSRIQFIWNMSDQWKTISLSLNDKYKKAFWLNADSGTAGSVGNFNRITYELPPYGTVLLYASTHEAKIEGGFSVPFDKKSVDEIVNISDWNLKVDSLEIENTSLFDWKNHEQLKFVSKEGVYSAKFTVDNIGKDHNYVLDLGKVYYTAKLEINGQYVGDRVYSPFVFNISDYIKDGENSIIIHVKPGALNGMIGEAEKGNPRYNKFKDRADDVMSAGLLGPIVVCQE